jgi:hypothetical protein
MITEEAILEAMDEIDLGSIEEYILDSNDLVDFVYSLVHDGDYPNKVSSLKAMVEARKYILAADLALQKELNSKVGRG